MTSYNFSLIDKTGTVTNSGTLFLNKDDTKLALAEKIDGVSFIELSETKIKDKDNFIAAVIRRLDKQQAYKAVRAGRPKKDTPILREDPSAPTDRVYVMERGSAPLVIMKDEVLTLQDIHNNDVQVAPEQLGFKPVDVPVNFEYTKNPILNEIYARAAVPADFNRKLSRTIVKQVKKLRDSGRDDWQLTISYRAPMMTHIAFKERKIGVIALSRKELIALESKHGMSL